MVQNRSYTFSSFGETEHRDKNTNKQKHVRTVETVQELRRREGRNQANDQRAKRRINRNKTIK